MDVSTVLIGYDPSDRAKRALEFGVRLATALAAELHLVTAFTDSPSGGVQVSAARREAEARLDDAAAAIAPTGRVRVHAIPGRPADAIVDVAALVHADLIVIGNRGAQRAVRALGSIASAVIGRAACSVLVVKTD